MTDETKKQTISSAVKRMYDKKKKTTTPAKTGYNIPPLLKRPETISGNSRRGLASNETDIAANAVTPAEADEQMMKAVGAKDWMALDEASREIQEQEFQKEDAAFNREYASEIPKKKKVGKK